MIVFPAVVKDFQQTMPNRMFSYWKNRKKKLYISSLQLFLLAFNLKYMGWPTFYLRSLKVISLQNKMISELDEIQTS